jgi:biotin carboxyl carrier protein
MRSISARARANSLRCASTVNPTGSFCKIRRTSRAGQPNPRYRPAAPIPGLILDIKVTVGESVVAGQSVATIEAMKMENSLTSTVSGTVKEIRVQKGAQVATGDVVMIIG